jgi:hypothetical protein
MLRHYLAQFQYRIVLLNLLYFLNAAAIGAAQCER